MSAKLRADLKGPLYKEKSFLGTRNPNKIEDVVVIGLTATQADGFPTFAVKGWRWSKVDNDGKKKLTEKKAAKFINKHANMIQEGSFDIVNKSRGLLDIDINRPTFIAVVSPFPKLTFDLCPIGPKTPNGHIDPHITDVSPRLWSLSKSNGTVCPQQVLGLVSVFKWGSPNNRCPAGAKMCRFEHNYYMTLTSTVTSTDGQVMTGTLPIIIDPGNNNGGGAQFP